MHASTQGRHRRRPGWFAAASFTTAVLAVTACSSSKPKVAASAPTTGSTGSTAPASSPPGTSFGVANVAGLGAVVVDGRGRTVYLLTSATQKNVPCDDATGCTKIWPDLPLPDGTSAATAGAGLQASLLGTQKLADGETYPTYNGWLMYEFTGDTGPAQGHGQQVTSFGGTWYAISPAGTRVTAAGSGS